MKHFGVGYMIELANESDIHKSLHHPNIVQYMGLCKINDIDMYIVTEYMQGGTLLDAIRNRLQNSKLNVEELHENILIKL